MGQPVALPVPFCSKVLICADVELDPWLCDDPEVSDPPTGTFGLEEAGAGADGFAWEQL